jgi:predicted RNase H-like HicB family nuclease
MNNKLRCYAKKEGSDWVAVCIDLSLAAQAESPQLAKEKLESMIMTYVNEALNEHKEYSAQLLSRKAPFSQQLTYYKALAFCFIAEMLHRTESNESRVFIESYPVVHA